MSQVFHQLVPTYSPRDAIGSEVYLLRECLRNAGFKSDIYCRDGFRRGDSLSADRLQRDLEKNQGANVLFHFSIGTDLIALWSRIKCKRWLRYHNITPSEFFSRPDELHARHACSLGRLQLPQLVACSEVLVADSNFNAAELGRFTSKKAHVIPVFRNYEGLVRGNTHPDLFKKINEHSVATVIFIGRVAPNKCHHDLLQLLALHKKISRRRVRVVFAGSYFSKSYQEIIANFASNLGLTLSDEWDFNADVIALGSISDEQLTTLYKSAKLYASMSEHEGFGVPIVEAMFFDLPVFAHSAAAVPEVLGSGSFLVNKFDWVAALDVFEKALFDEPARDLELARVRKWREQFQLRHAEEKMLKIILETRR